MTWIQILVLPFPTVCGLDLEGDLTTLCLIFLSRKMEVRMQLYYNELL